MRVLGQNRILVIDKDEKLTGVLTRKLGGIGYSTHVVCCAEDGFTFAAKNKYDAVVIDVTLPDLNGMEICKKLREQGFVTPILMVSSDLEDRTQTVRCLDLGADDYLKKPFSHKELIARLRALVRRNQKSFDSRWVRNGDVELDIPGCKVTIDHQTISLTKKETLLLKRLMYESPDPISRQALLRDVWGIDDLHTSNRLDVYIRRLRWKLDTFGCGELVHTARGNGYYFKTRS